MKKILFFTEASSEIGMGHFYQSYALAENLQEFEIYFAFSESSIVPKIVRRVTDHNISMYHNILNIEAIVDDIEPDFIFLNFRNFPEAINQFLFFERKIKTIVTDDNGNIKVACNLLINYTFSNLQKHYTIVSTKEETLPLFGVEYFPLRKQFFDIKKNSDKSNIITIFLGGSDRSNASGKITDDILDYPDKEFKINIIIGQTNKNKAALYKKYESDNKVHIFEDIENIAEVFANSFITINTGGTALYELAFLGIPTIILWEDKHEKQLAEDFNKHGFSRTAGQVLKYKKENLFNEIRFLSVKSNRKIQKIAGMQLVKAQKGLKDIKDFINQV